jgi:hypothetical protein
MKLKGKASGDKGIPEMERVFFSVALPVTSKLDPKAVFISKVRTRVSYLLAACIKTSADAQGCLGKSFTSSC